VLNNLTMIRPRVSDAIGLRELAFVLIGTGSFLTAFLNPLLTLAGRRRDALAAASKGVQVSAIRSIRMSAATVVEVR
jgi:hypothetical protein